MTPVLALGIALLGGLLAWQARALTLSGGLAAALVACIVLASTGWQGGLVLASFFVPSTLVSQWGARRGGVGDARGERRDAIQVFANGGVASLGSAGELLAPGLGFWLLTASLAAAAADTWATAWGAFSRKEPRMLWSWERVRRGTSGGVSLTGTLGGIAGGCVVAGSAALLQHSWVVCGAGALIGATGMLLDSSLGAALQGRFRCPACAIPSERRQHGCGVPTQLVGGWGWLDNDGVNALATLSAALLAALTWRWV